MESKLDPKGDQKLVKEVKKKGNKLKGVLQLVGRWG